METLLKQFKEAVEKKEIKILVSCDFYNDYIELFLQDNKTKEQYLFTISLL